MRPHRLDFLICLLLIVATLAVYWQVQGHDFVSLDDELYVTRNHRVQAGLTPDSVIWAFTATHASNWHPLTWLSHMLDCQLYGLNPKGHHLTNLLLHLANTLLLFLVLKWMTGTLWQSAFVAAFFALHPLHVESVAWVAERKDVLSTFFWLLTMAAYGCYAMRPGLVRYLLVLLLFALGLMAKPMLVTLPFVMLLLDYWPLCRLQLGQSCQESNLEIQASPASRLVWEKVPFFALTVVSSWVTFLAQQKGESLVALDLLSLKIRFANALVSYVSYIGKMFWPHPLAVFYPFPATRPMWQVMGAGFFLICVSVILVRAARRLPYLTVGWLWYLGTLVPVIGLVQVGPQAMADRYTYVPLIGLLVMFAWGVPDLVRKWRHRRIVFTMSTGMLLLVLMICTWLQIRVWKNSIALFEHTVKVTTNNSLAHNSLGAALTRQGSLEKAINHYSEALRINPNFARAHYNLGTTLAEQGRLDAAIGHYSEALQIKPNFAEAHHNLGVALAKQGRLDAAIGHYSEALQIKSDFAEAHNNLGIALARQGSLKGAIKHFSKALQIKPDYVDARRNLEYVLKKMGEAGETGETGETE